jgi:hypothetical protein
MGEPLEAYEYGHAYWIQLTVPGKGKEFLAAITTINGTTTSKPSHQWMLGFENDLGRDGWLIWRNWEILLLDQVGWLRQRVREEHPEIDSASQLSTFICDIRRRVSRP